MFRRPAENCAHTPAVPVGWNQNSRLNPAMRTNGTPDFVQEPVQPGCYGMAASCAGSWIVTVVPPRGGHVMLICPRCASTSRLAVGRPRPDPRALVVKNGVKILS